MSIKHLDNEEGYRNNDDNNLSFADTWYERGKKAKKKNYAMETFMLMCNYFPAFPLCSLSSILWDLDLQIATFSKTAILILFSKKPICQGGVVFYFSLTCKWQIVTFLLQCSFVSEKTQKVHLKVL